MRIEPYYQDDHVTLDHGDCPDVLPMLSGVETVLTSPPYNLSEGGRSVSGKDWNELKGGYVEYGDDMPHADYVAWQKDVLLACWTALTDDGAIFYNHKPITRQNAVRLPTDLNPGLPLRQIVTWDRGLGFVNCHNYLTPRYEWLLVLARDAFRYSRLGVFDLWKINPETNTPHPAPFPLSLARQVMDVTGSGPVLDPFAGSGTTLRAAKDAGRQAIGIELSERYCEIAAKRLAQGVLDFGAA